MAQYPGNPVEERDVDNPNAMHLQELSDLLTADASQSHTTTVEIGIGDSLPGLRGVISWGMAPFPGQIRKAALLRIMLQHRES